MKTRKTYKTIKLSNNPEKQNKELEEIFSKIFIFNMHELNEELNEKLLESREIALKIPKLRSMKKKKPLFARLMILTNEIQNIREKIEIRAKLPE